MVLLSCEIKLLYTTNHMRTQRCTWYKLSITNWAKKWSGQNHTSGNTSSDAATVSVLTETLFGNGMGYFNPTIHSVIYSRQSSTTLQQQDAEFIFSAPKHSSEGLTHELSLSQDSIAMQPLPALPTVTKDQVTDTVSCSNCFPSSTNWYVFCVHIVMVLYGMLVPWFG